MNIQGWTDDQIVQTSTKSQATGLIFISQIFISPLQIMALNPRAGGTSEGLLQLGH
jgi:hypothetical protein